MTLAADARRAAEAHPFLVDAMRAGVVNYTAAARFLGVDGETNAVATALRRYADDLPPYDPDARDARVTMESGVGPVDSPADALLAVGGTAIGSGGGDGTAILATGEVDAGMLAAALETLAVAGIDVRSAGVGADALVVVVDRLDGANAVRAIERAIEAVPDRSGEQAE